MKKRHGLDMLLPEGKLPGFYAQIVKGLADAAPPIDRHKELLIYEDESAFPPALELLSHYKVGAEPCVLLMAPAEGVVRKERFGDFAVETREGNVYFDLAYAAAFRMTEEKPEAESAPALGQLEETMIAEVNDNGQSWIVIERQLAELADRIARAYRCGIVWLDAENL